MTQHICFATVGKQPGFDNQQKKYFHKIHIMYLLPIWQEIKAVNQLNIAKMPYKSTYIVLTNSNLSSRVTSLKNSPL